MAKLPKYNPKKGWTGGDSRRLYAFTDKRTGKTTVRPVYAAVGIGPEVTVRPAKRSEAERDWQNPLHSGWKVELGTYRHLPIIKRVGGKTRRYSNLAVFGRECGKRNIGGNICELIGARRLKDGGGLATVRTRPGFTRSRPAGTWRLHFASYEVMKGYLKGRVIEEAVLLGRRRGR